MLFTPLNMSVEALISGDAWAELTLAELGPLATLRFVISSERFDPRPRIWGAGLGGERGLCGESAEVGGVSLGMVRLLG